MIKIEELLALCAEGPATAIAIDTSF